MATSTVQVRIDEDLKAKATSIYDELGMDLSTAVRMFLKRSVLVNGVPFSMILPQKDSHAKDAVEALFDSGAEAMINGTSEMDISEIDAEIEQVRSKR